MIDNPLIIALDTEDLVAAERWAGLLEPYAGAVKLGLEFFTAQGRSGVARAAEKNVPIFLDLKFHDIPNTVAGAVRAAMMPGVFMLTLHASGGKDMLKAAVDAAAETAAKRRMKRPLLLGVTVLTSMDAASLRQTGVFSSAEEQALRLAELAAETGLDGCVCSAHEVEKVRARIGRAMTLVVPGIRPRQGEKNDQKRVMGPREALEKGADYLVIGRPITQAPDPVCAARSLLAEIRH